MAGRDSGNRYIFVDGCNRIFDPECLRGTCADRWYQAYCKCIPDRRSVYGSALCPALFGASHLQYQRDSGCVRNNRKGRIQSKGSDRWRGWYDDRCNAEGCCKRYLLK